MREPVVGRGNTITELKKRGERDREKLKEGVRLFCSRVK